MKRRFFSACLALALLAALGFTGPVTAEEQVPFKGRLVGSFTAMPVDPSNPLVVAVQLNATGNATHLGAFTYDFPHIVNRSVMPSLAVGSSTFTAANGDKVFANVIGQASPVAPGVLYTLERATITGGTGRFASASGEFVMERLINQISLTTMGSFEGTISSPGAGNPQSKKRRTMKTTAIHRQLLHIFPGRNL